MIAHSVCKDFWLLASGAWQFSMLRVFVSWWQKIFKYTAPGVLLLISLSANAQIVDSDDESRLYAQTKQVNQFLRRFNGEEDEKGKRYYPRDRQYRSEKLRKKYLSILFNADNAGMTSDLKVQFAKQVLDEKNPAILDFHGGNWFAEVHTVFTMNNKDQQVILFMELEKAQLGSKWVITKVFADMFKPYFSRDTTKVGRFIHPMSHELDFMTLRKAFNNSDSISQFTTKKFVPDHLSVFLYEIRKGNLKFRTVTQVKFHFFQVEGWYFELSDFNRSGYNTGWLISNLVKFNNPAQKDILKKYLYYDSR
jgi:hypothetical protein